MKAKSSIRQISAAMKKDASMKEMMAKVNGKKTVADSIIACLACLSIILNIIEVS